MDRSRIRFWLLTGLNIATAVTLLLFLLEDAGLLRGLLSDRLLVLLIFSVFCLVPLLLVLVFLLGRRPREPVSRGQKFYARVSYGFLALCWLVLAVPAVFWGALFVAAREPWPLSLRQGPDTDHAKQGFERLFGFAPDDSQSPLYFNSFNVRDASYFTTFRYDDPDVIARITASRDLVSAPVEARDDARFGLRVHRSHLSWWRPEAINATDSLFVDRPTAEKITGTRAWNSPTGYSRILWVDETTRTAYYRELEF